MLVLITASAQRAWVVPLVARLNCDYELRAAIDRREPNALAVVGQVVILVCNDTDDGLSIVRDARRAAPRLMLCVLCVDAQTVTAATFLDDAPTCGSR